VRPHAGNIGMPQVAQDTWSSAYCVARRLQVATSMTSNKAWPLCPLRGTPRFCIDGPCAGRLKPWADASSSGKDRRRPHPPLGNHPRMSTVRRSQILFALAVSLLASCTRSQEPTENRNSDDTAIRCRWKWNAVNRLLCGTCMSTAHLIYSGSVNM